MWFKGPNSRIHFRCENTPNVFWEIIDRPDLLSEENEFMCVVRSIEHAPHLGSLHVGTRRLTY